MTSGVSYGLTLRPNVSFASCSRVGWSVPELGTNLGTNSIRRNFRGRQVLGKEWWAGAGLTRRHQDFQSCAEKYRRVPQGIDCRKFNSFPISSIHAGTCQYPREHGQSHGQSFTARQYSPSPGDGARGRVDSLVRNLGSQCPAHRHSALLRSCCADSHLRSPGPSQGHSDRTDRPEDRGRP